MPNVVVFVVVYRFDVVVLFVVVAQLSEDVSLTSWSWRRRKCAQFNLKSINKKNFHEYCTGPFFIIVSSQVLLSTEDWLGAAPTNLGGK